MEQVGNRNLYTLKENEMYIRGFVNQFMMIILLRSSKYWEKTSVVESRDVEPAEIS